MANPLPKALATGTLGELLVQFRLLQFDIQAAPPLKDSGNDLVAFRNRQARTIQVKCATNKISRDKRLPEHYDILAIVWLSRREDGISADESRIFLIPRSAVSDTARSAEALAEYELLISDPGRAHALLEKLFDGCS